MPRWLDVRGKSAAGPPENKALTGPPENKRGEPGALAGVDFASDEAAELAAQHGLTSSSFSGFNASGVRGYTLSDVRKVAAG